MVAASVQQGLGQENGLSMPSRLCLGAPSEYSDQVLVQLCELQGAIISHHRPSQPWASCRAIRITLLNQRLSWSLKLRNVTNRCIGAAG